MQNEVQVGNIGTVFKIRVVEDDVAVNISTATAKQIVLKPPTGQSLTKTATFFTDGTDGIITYTTQQSDLSKAGQWYIQAVITFTSAKYYTEVIGFVVRANI